ncbi:MAG: FAD/NAD(P)-binding oxidoreductase, partial [Oscillospiraceae bacterium]
MKQRYRVCVLGGGPAGLAAAVSAANEGAQVFLVEREAKLGGILKQCIHDGFGLLRFGQRLTGPEYSERYIQQMLDSKVDYITSSFVTDVKRLSDGGFELEIQSAEGMLNVEADTLVLACGCREKTSRQVFIHGERPAGIYSAGTAQYFVNIMGYMPTKRCVILGSGDIGMIMARRLTLEGAEVEGVYEIKDTPAGLARNVAQCLNDFDIPLHLSTTVTRIIGNKRVEAIEVAQVDKK